MGTEFLVIILLWCGQYPDEYSHRPESAVYKCRKEKIECVQQLEAFTTDDVINKCLLK